jgi:vacuolar-type H+-ATPase subunit F/Vma7
VKLVGSWKLESGVDKEDVREKKKEDLKNKEKKIVKHEHGIVIILTFKFEHINRLLF